MQGIRMTKMIYCPKDREVRTSGSWWKDKFKTWRYEDVWTNSKKKKKKKKKKKEKKKKKKEKKKEKKKKEKEKKEKEKKEKKKKMMMMKMKKQKRKKKKRRSKKKKKRSRKISFVVCLIVCARHWVLNAVCTYVIYWLGIVSCSVFRWDLLRQASVFKLAWIGTNIPTILWVWKVWELWRLIGFVCMYVCMYVFSNIFWATLKLTSQYGTID